LPSTIISLTINNSAGVSLTSSATASGALTLTNGILTAGANTVAVASGGTVTRTNGYIIGNLQRTFAAAGSLTFDVGTANGYSPVAVNATAGTFPANFTVKATQGKLPQISGANALTRYWTLTGTGLTANLTFTYLAGDVTGTVANYKFIKNSSGALSTLNPDAPPTATTATISGVSSFSDWTLAEPSAVQSGSFQFSAPTYSVGEGGGSIAVTVARAGGSDGAVSVAYATGGGTATAGSDYTAQSGTFTWVAGDPSSRTINIPITDDNVYEGNETFDVNLSSPGGGATLGTPSTATVTINENESQPTISVGDVSVTEPASGQSYAQFPVTLSGVSAQTVTVSFSTANGTAVAPGDYTTLSGTVTFAPGETQKIVAVAIKSDAVSEPDETFNLNLSGPVNATIADGSGVATITQPVAAGTVLISEFRLRGPSGVNDEFVEVYNNTDADITVTDANPATCALQAVTLGLTTPCGWALVDLQGSVSSIPRFVIATGTVIPARGHYLAAGTGYSLSAAAAADLTYDPPGYGDADFTGLALYKTADRAQFTQANTFDAVGFDGVASAFREGNGLLPSDGVTTDVEHSFVRNQGSGRPADTGDNRADFTLVATNPSQITNGVAVLGAPGPENKTGPVSRNSGFAVGVPPGVASSLRTTSPAVTNGDLGTLSLRRRFTNNTGQSLTKLRFRVTDVSTLNSRLVFGSQAEMRVLDAQLTGLTGLKATTVEATPAHALGGGMNMGLVINGSLTLSQPLASGQSVDVEFLLGVMKGGSYQFILVVEAAP
jgi:chitinase